jgi:hypothetical protein
MKLTWYGSMTTGMNPCLSSDRKHLPLDPTNHMQGTSSICLFTISMHKFLTAMMFIVSLVPSFVIGHNIKVS